MEILKFSVYYLYLIIKKMVNNFLKRLSTSGNIEINTLNRVFSSIEEVEDFNSQNIFFCCWLKPWLDRRCGDNDILDKNYFVLDLDIRNNSEEEMSDDEIVACADILEEKLEGTPFATWSYIIFSWNWLHLYYIWETITPTATEYSRGVGYIYKEWERVIDNSLFKPDYACRNISRIMRLPWSTNQKNWAVVTILKEKTTSSNLIKYISKFAEKEKILEDAEVEKRQKAFLETKQRVDLSSKNSIYDDINQIPAWQVSEWLNPQFKYSGNRNFHSDNPKKNKWTAFYYSESRNCIINWGSAHYNWWTSTSGYWPFELVKYSKDWSNRETFEFFKKLLWK